MSKLSEAIPNPDGEQPHIDKYQPSKALKPAPMTQHVKHVAVRDEGAGSHEESLNAFMVQPQYLQRKMPTPVGPKRPLGQRVKTPAAMYSQVATFGSMDRIRRPRVDIPVSADSSYDTEASPHDNDYKKYLAAATAAIVGALVFVKDKASAAGHYVVSRAHIPHIGRSRTTYNVWKGADLKRFGMEESWFKIVAPAALLFLVVGIVMFSHLLDTGSGNAPGGSNGATGGGANGNAVLQVKPTSGNSANTNTGTAAQSGSAGSAAANNGGAGSGATPQAATSSGQTQGAAAGGLQSTPAYGGSGGGGQGGGTSSTPVYTYTPAPVTTYTPPAPNVTPTPSPAPVGGGGSSGGSGGASLPINPPAVPPVTVPKLPSVPDVTTPVSPKSTINSTLAPVTNSVPAL